MKGSVQYDKHSKRYYIALYWEKNAYRFFNHKDTGDPFWSKQSAEKQLGRLRSEVDSGEFNPKHWKHGNPLLIKKYAFEFLDSSEAIKKTLSGYRGHLKNWIIPYFGDKDIRTIRYPDLIKFQKDIKRSDKTRYNILSTLKAMLHFAWKSEDIRSVPPFPPLKYTKPRIKYLTLEQQETVLSHIPERHRPIFHFMMDYGCRPQEARALQKDCIVNGEVVFCRSFSVNELRETTKTDRIRRFGITPYIAEVLKGLPPHLSPYVFVRDDGNPYTSTDLNRIWHDACDKADIHIKMYNACKHSLGCQLLSQGVEKAKVKKIYGHSDRSDMVDRYAEWSTPALTDELINRRNVVKFNEKQERDNQ